MMPMTELHRVVIGYCRIGIFSPIFGCFFTFKVLNLKSLNVRIWFKLVLLSFSPPVLSIFVICPIHYKKEVSLENVLCWELSM